MAEPLVLKALLSMNIVPQPQILVTCASSVRGAWYRDVLTSRGFAVTTTVGGVECLTHLRSGPPNLILLEASLPWGGAEGVLDIRQHEERLREIPVVLAAIGGVSASIYQMAGYSIQGYFSRIPNPHELSDFLWHVLRDSGTSSSRAIPTDNCVTLIR
jgi:CheY-like chemotaxis protein